MEWVRATWLENEKLEDGTFKASWLEQVNGKQFVRLPNKNAADAVARKKLPGPNWFMFEVVSLKIRDSKYLCKFKVSINLNLVLGKFLYFIKRKPLKSYEKFFLFYRKRLFSSEDEETAIE